ncbi:SDR family NAD(P)-dependent oxidoreductase [Streptomyces fulvoviolaceus]|uniref:SDR family NAD(P)-dependent oxidoreductase n=1 Tax=Streptomyces fulvoviolaceus TaxID=285535 RepID=UPI0021C152FB|nr:SDR family NAD(P)-dependent oxidoreductase [Streptomyces fulvoviolaceus]MCT9075168.1 SDR family oxidoreductase [Streptomyces fulvoviolaceus]
MSNGLHERSVVVTGAGSDVGRATAVRFAREGAYVLVADLRRAGADETVKAVADVGGTALAVVGDLSDQQVVDQVVDTAVEVFGGVDVLVHNAAIMDRMSVVSETGDAEWYRVLEVNLTAPFLLTRAVLPHMMAEGRGSIVFTAVEAGPRGSIGGAASTASRHGVLGLVRSLAATYPGVGIRTNAIAPARVATAVEQAAAIVFLASDAAAHLNGTVLPVDEGWSAA